MKPKIILLNIFLLCAIISQEQTVTNINNDGSGSLRQAILDANANPGTDNISFNIPGTGPHTIQPTSPLPEITDPVVIDGYTQPGAAAATQTTDAVLMIELDGTYAGTEYEACGLIISSGSSTVRGLVINRFHENGIKLTTNGNNVIEGNFIGTDVTGSQDLGNNNYGVWSQKDGNIIGGTSPGAGNIISGNGSKGIVISGIGTVVQGNYIGTDVTGTQGLGNGSDGIYLREESDDCIIGGAEIGAGNVISDNSGGIFMNSHLTYTPSGHIIQGNFIGTDITGTVPLGNTHTGIAIADGDEIMIGGSNVGEGNIIAFNGYYGVSISDGTNNTISSNSIFSNTSIGINLGDDHPPVTPNDPGDADTGPNNYQNFPVLTAVTGDAVSTTIEGSLNSAPNTSFTIEFFSNSAVDPTGFGEGETYLGETSVTTDAGGDAIINAVLSVVVPQGSFITATATDPDGSTSEFSEGILSSDIEPPVLSGVPNDISVECDAVPPPAEVTAEDNVDGIVSVSYLEEIIEGSCENLYTLVRTWTASDEAGNTASASQTITVEDNTSPTLTAPADVTIECDMPTDPASTGFATATDNCDAAPVVEYSDEAFPGNCPNSWTINRTWTATDACGNSASIVQVITIVDTEAPALITPVDLTIECDMDNSPDAIGYATAADNCDAAPVITYTDEQVAGSCANEYTINRSWTATDACGNAATAVQVISVIDVTIPVIIGVPTASIIQGNDAGYCGAFIDYPEITATDNCSESVNLTLDPSSGALFPVGITEVTVTATDDCGNKATDYFNVEITNDIPVIESLIAPVDPVQLGFIVNTTSEFTDNNLSEAVWDWGDGTNSAGIIDGQNITGDHLYEIPGVYILTLTITDMCGETDTEIYQYVVIYDPNGGFITGGGWINSPPGAYTDDPSLEGKANFGFVSKYKKGKEIPEGNTEFQFNAGNLKFKSTSYYWLVIAGSKAKFKGEGAINGLGTYGFMISAIDGDLKDNGEVDRFRIKIWDVADETVIYDNEIEASDIEDPTTALGGGSIVIHIPKTKSSSVFSEDLISFGNDGDIMPTMLIYPNPAKDNINIVVSGKEEQSIQLKIYNSTGQLIYISSGKGMINEEISLKDYKSGLYSVIAVVDGKLIIQKVLIE